MSDLRLLSILSHFPFRSFRLESEGTLLVNKGEEFKESSKISFLGNDLGLLSTDLNLKSNQELAQHLAPLVYLHKTCGLFTYAIESLVWVSGAKNVVPEVTDWIGIYYKAKAFTKEDTKDLILGAFLGEPTEHQRIPLERGLCGLALREERVVNVANVHEDNRHIACSLKTNSELIIPLKNEFGELVAELDIDCHRLGAFTPEIEKMFKGYAETFSQIPRN